MVIDKRAELGRDRVADLPDVVQTVELPAQTLQHLEVCDGADVALDARRIGPTRRIIGVENDLVLSLRLRSHHRRLRARRELARVHGVLGSQGEPDRDGHPPDTGKLDRNETLLHPLGHADGVLAVAVLHDDGKLLAAEPADAVLRANDRAQRLG